MNRAKDVTRNVPTWVQHLLWGRAAGRCEFAGCNQRLWQSPTTGEQVNIAEKAHIYSFSDNGPRGNAGVDRAALNDISNLILACQACHTLIDADVEGDRYSVERLQSMKKAHEDRVELVTGIDQSMKSHVLHYGANIGAIGSPLHWKETAKNLFPKRYPAQDRPLELGTINGSLTEKDAGFWDLERRNLESKFRTVVHERMATGEIEHLSVFALAPQPLLIRLGTLLTDIPEVEVFQHHREPKGWGWPESGEGLGLLIHEPSECTGEPVLVLALSGSISPERVFAVLGRGVSIWTLTVADPNNDMMRSPAQLKSFRRSIRRLFDRIKAAHGQERMLHVFPAAPISVAVELGRTRSPKADTPWRLYDQVNELGGFVHAMDIQ